MLHSLVHNHRSKRRLSSPERKSTRAPDERHPLTKLLKRKNGEALFYARVRSLSRKFRHDLCARCVRARARQREVRVRVRDARGTKKKVVIRVGLASTLSVRRRAFRVVERLCTSCGAPRTPNAQRSTQEASRPFIPRGAASRRARAGSHSRARWHAARR